jgi:hypothetical protein
LVEEVRLTDAVQLAQPQPHVLVIARGQQATPVALEGVYARHVAR